MGSEHIAVNFGALDAASGALRKMAADFNTNQEEMAAGIRPLHNIWVASGSAAGAQYDASTLKINLHEDHMIGLVQAFSQKVEEARSTQLAMENSLALSFNA